MEVRINIDSSTGFTMFTFASISDEGPNYRPLNDDAIRSITDALIGCSWITDVHTAPITATLAIDEERMIEYPAP